VLRQLCVPVATGKRATVLLRGRSDETSLVEVTGFAERDPLLIVQTTVETILGDPDRFGRAFYRELFTLLPAARAMFRGDMPAQTRMFVEVLRSVLHGLARFDELAPSLRAEGRRHLAYGARPEHFPVLTRAFVHALRDVLGDRHDAEIERAWVAVLERIGSAMLEGMDAPTTHDTDTQRRAR
jgi:hemoglobin-like flavoprotein